MPESSGGVVDSVVALDLPPLAPPPSPPSASPPSKQQSASPAHASGAVGGDEAGEEHLLHEVMGYDRKSRKPAHRPQAPSMARRGLLKVTPARGEREGLGGAMSVWPTRLCMPDCLVVGEQDLDFFADEQQQHAQQPATPPQQHRRGVTPTLPSATHTPTAARAQHAGRQPRHQTPSCLSTSSCFTLCCLACLAGVCRPVRTCPRCCPSSATSRLLSALAWLALPHQDNLSCG